MGGRKRGGKRESEKFPTPFGCGKIATSIQSGSPLM